MQRYQSALYWLSYLAARRRHDRNRVIGSKRGSCGGAIQRPEKRETSMRWLTRMASLAVACIWLPACASLGTAAPTATPVSVSRGCAHFQRHQYEVCYAYVVNDTFLARVPYYEFGRDPSLGLAALTRLESRFYGPARSSIIRQARGWPRHVDVSAPQIRIVGRVSVSANLATATLHTVETWLVRAESGRVLFAVKDARLTITLHRTPTMLCLAGHCLHKWVVVLIR